MKRVRVLTVFGTRPEAIKMCPLVLGMQARPKQFTPITCVTGQHREMLRRVVETFDVSSACQALLEMIPRGGFLLRWLRLT